MRPPALLGALLFLSACDKTASKPAPASSTSAPPATAAAVSASPSSSATSSSPSPAASGSSSAAPAPHHDALPPPTFTAGRSKVPTFKEWKDAPAVAVRNARSLWCETKAVREWLRVSCRSAEMAPNQVAGVVNDGAPVGEVYTFNGERVASAVIAVRPGTDARLTYNWTNWGERTFSVKYPKDAASPQLGFNRGGPKGRDGVPLCDDVCFLRWHHKSDLTCNTPCEPGFRCEQWRDSGEVIITCVCDVECADREEAEGTTL